ncbi:LOW QUALITY PROTEIN: hypothetical protein PanWU01x14_179440 [Parasponia andersonii]|uniref:Uncharacterized protein n=1 Tax=Parasponia andersonii TaxID=3476 RepID=A0A2P5C6L5_PARAD|nr:LOW QUALITY PROTEIN: hypothetical protein PanWU01x14_179440 [Parasponia andersonii]
MSSKFQWRVKNSSRCHRCDLVVTVAKFFHLLFPLRSFDSSEKVQSLFMVTNPIRKCCQDSSNIYIQQPSNLNRTFHY